VRRGRGSCRLHGADGFFEAQQGLGGSGRRSRGRSQSGQGFLRGFGLGAETLHERALELILVDAQVFFATEGGILVAGEEAKFFAAIETGHETFGTELRPLGL
jgi:hypothetical protein